MRIICDWRLGVVVLVWGLGGFAGCLKMPPTIIEQNIQAWEETPPGQPPYTARPYILRVLQRSSAEDLSHPQAAVTVVIPVAGEDEYVLYVYWIEKTPTPTAVAISDGDASFRFQIPRKHIAALRTQIPKRDVVFAEVLRIDRDSECGKTIHRFRHTKGLKVLLLEKDKVLTGTADVVWHAEVNEK